jgi:hypothetical protein
MPNTKPTKFYVDYTYTTTERGVRNRSSFTTGLGQINGAQSESAVLAYLRKKHNAFEVTIMKLDWK